MKKFRKRQIIDDGSPPFSWPKLEKEIKSEKEAIEILENWYGMCPENKQCSHCAAVRYLKNKILIRENGLGGITASDSITVMSEIRSAV